MYPHPLSLTTSVASPRVSSNGAHRFVQWEWCGWWARGKGCQGTSRPSLERIKFGKGKIHICPNWGVYTSTVLYFRKENLIKPFTDFGLVTVLLKSQQGHASHIQCDQPIASSSKNQLGYLGCLLSRFCPLYLKSKTTPEPLNLWMNLC